MQLCVANKVFKGIPFEIKVNIQILKKFFQSLIGVLRVQNIA